MKLLWMCIRRVPDVILGMDVAANRRDHVISTTRLLLEHAGYTDAKFNTYNSSSFSVKIGGVEGETGLLDVVSALSNDAKFEDGVTAYAVLPRETARDIAVMEMDRLAGGNENLFTPFMGKYEGALAQYVDVITQDTQAGQLLGINFIRENSEFSDLPVIFTEMDFSDGDVQKRTMSALKQAGVNANVSNGMVIADGSIDVVSPVMAKDGLLPSAMLPVIAAQVKNLRPETGEDFDVGEAFQ